MNASLKQLNTDPNITLSFETLEAGPVADVLPSHSAYPHLSYYYHLLQVYCWSLKSWKQVILPPACSHTRRVKYSSLVDGPMFLSLRLLLPI